MDRESAGYRAWLLRWEKNRNAARMQKLAFERPDDRRGREISSPASRRVFLPLNIFFPVCDIEQNLREPVAYFSR